MDQLINKYIWLFIAASIGLSSTLVLANAELEIGHVFAVAESEIEITGSGITRTKVGATIFIRSSKGIIKGIVTQTFHTKLKASVRAGHGLRKGDLVLSSVPSERLERIPPEPISNHGSYFASNKSDGFRFVPDRASLSYDKRVTKYPIIVWHAPRDFNPERRREMRLSPSEELMLYESTYQDQLFAKGSDFSFEEINSQTRAQWGHMGSFKCEIESKALECETCMTEDCTQHKKRTFVIRDDSIFYGHFYTKDDADKSCSLIGYKERRSIHDLVRVDRFEGSGTLIWHIFSSDGRTIDAAYLSQINSCM